MNTRLPVSLNEATWIMTDRVSTTRRVGVEPEKAETCPAECGAKNHDLAGSGHVGNAKVLGEVDVPGYIGEYAQRTAHQHRGHNGKAIESIGQVDRIAEANNE